MASPETPPFESGELPPKKVAWLHPTQLIRTAYQVWLSEVAAEYIDRRETLAALDAAHVMQPPENTSCVRRGKFIDAYVNAIPEGGLWIDYAADIGDSWEATYST